MEIRPASKPIELVELPDRLVQDVVARIRQEEELLKLRKTFCFVSFAFLLSLVGLVVALIRMFDGMAQSGFSPLASLLFSDTTVVLSYWQDFGYSLLEALPVTALVAVLVLMVAVLHFFQRVLADAKRVFLWT